ncbi:MAG: hypothetical protein MJZ11_09940 [Lachnospiraceae bacterium]|nr:hypothetical protein [Lachnospiraceae bacterium]
MKTSSIKKMLAVALATTTVMAMSFSAFATTTNNVVESGASSVAEVVVPTTSTAGGVKTTTAGVYMATVGTAVSTSAAEISSSYGLGAGEKAYTKVWDLKASTSPAAANAISAIAGTQNAVVGPMINLELGKMAGGKYSLLPESGAPITFAIALPASFNNAAANYAVICVRPGGAFEILPAVYSNGAVVFATTGGKGAYAVIKY